MFEKTPLDRSMQLYYERRAPEYDDWYDRRGRYHDPRTNPAWHAQLAELGREAARFGGGLARAPRLRVLDLACGTGKWSPYFVHSLQPTGRLVAFDYSAAMLAETRVRLEEDDPANLTKTLFVRGDAYALPFLDSAFDLIFMGFWLSHVQRERLYPFLGEVKRIMRPGGNLLVFDSALREGVPAEAVARRPLLNGQTYDVLKINYAPAQLEGILARLFPQTSVRQTRDFFLIAQASL